LILVMLACGGTTTTATDDSGPEPSTGPPPETFPTETSDCDITEGEWGVLSESVGDGVLLSAWSNGPTEVLMVGGDIAGGPCILVHYDGASLCTETAITDRALWWIHGATEGEWYAVGEVGTVLHEVNGVRTREDLPTTVTLYGVYATDEGVWAVGGDPFNANTGEVWRKTNEAWTQVAAGLPGVVFKVWEDLFVGADVAYLWNGTELVDVTPSERLLTVRGRSASEAFAVGGLGSPVMQQWDGSTWTPFDTTGLSGPLNGIWTSPEEDVWITSFGGLMGHWTGDAWEVPSPPVILEDFHAVWGHCNEVLFVGGNMLTGPPFYGTIGRYGTAQGAVIQGECP
jgi:hypothetical protein